MDGETWVGFLLVLGGSLLLLIPALLVRRLLLHLTAWPFRALGRALSKKPRPEKVVPRGEAGSEPHAAEALGADFAPLAGEEGAEDHGARPEVAAALEKHRAAEVLHEKSGVRVRVTLEGDTGYRLDVPTESLDPRRGQRHRARQVITDAGWRLYDADLGSAPGSLDESDESWGYSADSGDAKDAADAALRLLCAIAELPLDVRVRVTSRPEISH